MGVPLHVENCCHSPIVVRTNSQDQKVYMTDLVLLFCLHNSVEDGWMHIGRAVWVFDFEENNGENYILS